MADRTGGLGAALAGLVRHDGGITRGAEMGPVASRGEPFGRALPPLALTDSRGVHRLRRQCAAEAATVARIEASLVRIDSLLGRLFRELWAAGDPRLVLTAGALVLASLRCIVLDSQDFRLLRAAALQGLIIWLEDEAGRDGGPAWGAAILASDCALAEWMTEIALLEGALPERLARSWARQRAARLNDEIERGGILGAAAGAGTARAAQHRHQADLEAPGWELAESLLGTGAAAGREVSSVEIVRAGAWLGMLARLAVTARLPGSGS